MIRDHAQAITGPVDYTARHWILIVAFALTLLFAIALLNRDHIAVYAYLWRTRNERIGKHNAHPAGRHRCGRPESVDVWTLKDRNAARPVPAIPAQRKEHENDRVLVG